MWLRESQTSTVDHFSDLSDFNDLRLRTMSKVSFAVAAIGALMFHTFAVGFVVPNLQRSNSKGVQGVQGALPAAKLPEQVVPGHAVPTGAMVYGVAVLATAAAGLLARSKRASKVTVRNYGGFKPVVGDRYQYTNDAGYLADGTPISQAGNNSLHAAPPSYMQAPAPPPPAPAPVAPPPPVVTAPPVVGSYTLTSQEALHGVSFSYSMQKDAYADLEFLNDVGYLPDGTPLNRAGNCINHPETIQPDPHTPGTPLPRANLHNSVGYLPDGTAMNAAGNALNHPERMQPDMHVVGSPLPKSVYCADVGYLVDGTDLACAGNNFAKVATTTAPAVPPAPVQTVAGDTTVAAGFVSNAEALHGVSFSYSMQKDAYADLEFLNDVGYLPDGTPLNRAGNCINHPETIQPDPHTPGTPLPRANLHNSVGYLPDGTAMNAAGNALNHPERMQPDMHVVGSPLPKSVYCADDAYADLEFLNDVGYLPDGTPLNRAGNCINHPETIQPDPHTPGTPLPRANLHNSVGYLPDGTAMNAAGNALNHPERMQPDMHVVGSPLPKSVYCADVGYLVDGTDLACAGNNFAKFGMPVSAAPAATAAFVGTTPAQTAVRQPAGFAYAMQKDVYADFLFSNDVGYLPDGTPMNRAGNAMNHPENLQPDPHTDGSPLPRALFVNDVGYLPDGTPMNKAGNAVNHPERIPADPHAPGSALPASSYAADIGYLVDGTPMDAAGNNAVH
eukprot:symbB.v1.2.015952.t1/scaffold1203.1/size131588/19